MKKTLKNHNAFVIGGSNGIGAATVRTLAESGARVAVSYYKGEHRARDLIAELPGEGHISVQVDVEDGESVRRAAARVEEVFGTLHVLVNSAGTTEPIPHGDLDALEDEFIDQIFRSNVRGVFSMVRACRAMMDNSGDAVVVNVSSVSGFKGSGSNIAYCASKAAVDTMTLSLARALGPSIRVLEVSPGAVATDFVAGRDRARLENLAETSPLRKVVEPEDVADAIMACVTHLTAATGARIVVDAGRFLL
jgi:3-oxoacyl-[acyl-carrier protein] reductase